MAEGSWVDLVPTYERERLRKKLRSPEVYAESRADVKGPEKISEEMRWNEALAELKLAMDLEPRLKKVLQEKIAEELREKGVDALMGSDVPPGVQKLLEAGKFDVAITAPDASSPDQLVLLPEGNVSDKLPMQRSVSERYVTQFATSLYGAKEDAEERDKKQPPHF